VVIQPIMLNAIPGNVTVAGKAISLFNVAEVKRHKNCNGEPSK